ncbi:hypothetical protein OG944_23325 [Streptomyces anulatus]|uniref:hypothetical protein n=1 Tax=Streptomyces TaxID=1883 RepID=UPI001180E177|nr:hypothetical protein [Streptomyces sp. or3]WTC71705.1 hypothetical protein OG882_15710 [Streptomyces anulatus]
MRRSNQVAPDAHNMLPDNQVAPDAHNAHNALPARRTAGLRTRSSRRARPGPTGPEKSVRRGAPVREDLRP